MRPLALLLVLLSSCAPLEPAARPAWRGPLAGRAVPPPELGLEVGDLVGASIATVTVTQAPPGATVQLAWSLRGLGAGPCPTALAGRCLDLRPGVYPAPASGVADGAGTAVISMMVPPGLGGAFLGVQAIVQAPAVSLSAPVGRWVAPAGFLPDPAADQDGDGLSPLQGDCADALATIGPWVPDLPGDGVDQDCDGADGLAGEVPASAVVDGLGGTVSLPGGARLEVPLGALVGPTRWMGVMDAGATWISRAGFADLGPTWIVGTPDRPQTALREAGRLVLPADPAVIGGPERSGLRLAWTRGGMEVQLLPVVVDLPSATVSAVVTGGGAAGLVLLPPGGSDADGDGQVALVDGGTDCDDADLAVHLGAAETCGGGDVDCDGRDERWMDLAFTRAGPVALDEAGRVHAWGGGAEWVPELPGTYEAVVAGDRVVCGREAGGVYTCVSHMTETWPDALEGVWADLEIDHDGAAAVGLDGSLVCVGSSACVYAPVPEGDFVAVALGAYLGCGLRSSGELDCWGHGDIAHRTPGGVWVAVEVGEARACALDAGGEASCWSRTDDPAVVPGPWVDIEVVPIQGVELLCGHRRDGRLVCEEGGPLPADGVVIGGAWGAVGSDICGLDVDGALQCWGPTWLEPHDRMAEIWADAWSIVGGRGLNDGFVGGPHRSALPSRLVGYEALAEPVIDLQRPVETGWGCALTDMGEVRCFGEEAPFALPSALPGGPFVALMVRADLASYRGVEMACGRHADGQWACQGRDSSDFLGSSLVGLHDVRVEASGAACGLDDLGRVVCEHTLAGGSGMGLGRGVQPPAGRFRDLAGCLAGFVGLREDGRVEAWTAERILRVPEGLMAQEAACHGERDSACVLDLQGEVACFAMRPWADPRPTVQPPPGPLHGLVAVQDGFCALDEAGELVCWGWMKREAALCR